MPGNPLSVTRNAPQENMVGLHDSLRLLRITPCAYFRADPTYYCSQTDCYMAPHVVSAWSLVNSCGCIPSVTLQNT